MSRARELLGPTGPFATGLSRYEARPGQLEMAEAVEGALATGRTLLCEAGTGTGKTLAYLVPAVLSGRKVVVSTATRALQDQVFAKDLPIVAEALGVNPRAALVKGLGNYLCRRRHAAFRASSEADRPATAHTLSVVDRWVDDTEAGDLGELAAVAEGDPVLGAIQSSSDTRIGAGCRYHESCFVTQMKRTAEAAQIVVVNHHLFFADLALRGPHPGRVLPDYDAVVFDEAHHLEDIATAFFSIRVSESRCEHLVREVERAALSLGEAGASAGRLAARTLAASGRLFEVVRAAARGEEGRTTLEHDFWNGEPLERYHELDTALDGLASATEVLAGRVPPSGGPGAGLADVLEVAQRRATTLREDLSTIVEGAPGRITWTESGTRTTSLSSSPVDVSETFRERLFERVDGVVLTSATLTSGGKDDSAPFGFIKGRLGLGAGDLPVEEHVVASPFDFEKRALLYLPDDLPDPSAPGFLEAAASRTAELIRMTDGGVFVLSTSNRGMRGLHRALAGRLGDRRLFVQGRGAKSALLSAFRADRRAVLVATMSFWQGVDVPGDALRLVVIDKIPFPVPSDPIVRARGEQLEAAGRNPFMELSVPMAQIALKQGFGRLIRTRHDDGVVALLDARVHRRGYGRRLLSALPPAARTTALDGVRAFWASRDS